MGITYSILLINNGYVILRGLMHGNVIGQVEEKRLKSPKVNSAYIFTESIIIVTDIGMIVSILRPY